MNLDLDAFMSGAAAEEAGTAPVVPSGEGEPVVPEDNASQVEETQESTPVGIANVMTQTSAEEEESPKAFSVEKRESNTNDLLTRIEAEIAEKKKLVTMIEEALAEKDALDSKLAELEERVNGRGM